LGPSYHAPQLGDDQLQMFDLIVAAEQFLLLCAQLTQLRDDKGLRRLSTSVLRLMRVACASPWQGVCHKYFVVIDQSGWRHSIPFKSIKSYARVRATVPLVAWAQTKRPPLQSLLKWTEAVSVLPQQLDKIAALAAEDEDMPGVRRLLQYGLH
jgi:hypothetical protein